MIHISCIQCGTCCICCLCSYGEEVLPGPTGECGYLSVDEDDNAVCNCQDALDTFVGSGCVIRASDDLYLLHINDYNVDERKAALKEADYGTGTTSTKGFTLR